MDEAPVIYLFLIHLILDMMMKAMFLHQICPPWSHMNITNTFILQPAPEICISRDIKSIMPARCPSVAEADRVLNAHTELQVEHFPSPLRDYNQGGDSQGTFFSNFFHQIYCAKGIPSYVTHLLPSEAK